MQNRRLLNDPDLAASRKAAGELARDFATLMNTDHLAGLPHDVLSGLMARHLARRLPGHVSKWPADETDWSPMWPHRETVRSEVGRLHRYLREQVLGRIDHPAGWITAAEARDPAYGNTTAILGVRIREGHLQDAQSGAQWRLRPQGSSKRNRRHDSGSFIDLVDASKAGLAVLLKSTQGDVLVYAICRALTRWPWQRCVRCNQVFAFQRMGALYCGRSCSLAASNERLKAALAADPERMRQYRKKARVRMNAIYRAKSTGSWKPKRRQPTK